MKKKKKGNKTNIKETDLEKVAGGEEQTYTTTYECIIKGDYNVMVKGSGKQVLENFDKLYEAGMFDNLKKEV